VLDLIEPSEQQSLHAQSILVMLGKYSMLVTRGKEPAGTCSILLTGVEETMEGKISHAVCTRLEAGEDRLLCPLILQA
jgi:hypothetical protein